MRLIEKMKNIIVLIFLFPLFVTAQDKGGNEFTAWVGTHIYNHKKDVNSSFGQPLIDVKSTIGNSIIGDYKRVTTHHLLLHIGVEVGYEYFSGTIQYPFERFGYARPAKLKEQYHMNVTTIYGRINLGIGYRYKNIDILVGNMVQTPITSEQQYDFNLEALYFGGDNYNFHKQAYFGKDYDAAFVIDNISFLQLSTKIKLNTQSQHLFNIGLRIQKSLFFPQGSLNSFLIEYYDETDNIVGRDQYFDNQFAISLLVGYAL